VKRWLYVAVLVCGVAAAPPAASAQATPVLDLRLERDTRPGILSSALVVNLKLTVTERETAGPPQDTFEVYAFAEQPDGGKTEIFPCSQEHDSSPEVPRGVYLCTVLVDHGGHWAFSGVVNKLRANRDDPPVPLGRTAAELDIVTSEVAPAADENPIKGRLFEVALLWSHAAAAAVWLGAVGLVSILALPALRRRLSAFGRHRLEERFDLIAKSTWVATALLVASGTYLLLNQTAYETPFSSARIEAAFRLPYGKPYFLALAVKLSIYAVMVAASVVLLAEARRRLRSNVVVVPADIEDSSPSPTAQRDPSPWRTAGPEGRGGRRTAVADLPPVALEAPATVTEPERDAPAAVRAGAVVVMAGTVGLSLSITLLKYFHELIEAARALL
jgi:hypothetical protein